MLREGDMLPDITLLGPGGEAVSLARPANEHTLLIFLRHLT